MKVGVIGAGNWGKNLVENFAEMGVLAGVADTVEANLEAALEIAPAAQVFARGEELIAGDCDAVAIATPVPTHFELAAAALKAGKDVFVEKPMTLTSAESEELVRLAEDHGRILMVGHLLLFQPPIQFIKRFLEEGRLGRIYSLHQERKKLGRARYIENVTWSLGGARPCGTPLPCGKKSTLHLCLGSLWTPVPGGGRCLRPPRVSRRGEGALAQLLALARKPATAHHYR